MVLLLLSTGARCVIHIGRPIISGTIAGVESLQTLNDFARASAHHMTETRADQWICSTVQKHFDIFYFHLFYLYSLGSTISIYVYKNTVQKKTFS